jgi:hypothetical protein
MLRRLLAVQIESGFCLLSEEELTEIQRLWAADGDRNESAFKIWHPTGAAPREGAAPTLVSIAASPRTVGTL